MASVLQLKELDCDITKWKCPVPLLVHVMKPIYIQNEVHKSVATSLGHSSADPPAVLCILQSVMRLADRKPDLPQHGGQFVGRSLCV